MCARPAKSDTCSGLEYQHSVGETHEPTCICRDDYQQAAHLPVVIAVADQMPTDDASNQGQRLGDRMALVMVTHEALISARSRLCCADGGLMPW